MPRLLICNLCATMEKVPDVHPKTPLVPARLEYKDGEQYWFKDDDGHNVMVPAYDPVMEDFVERHEHDRPDDEFVRGRAIEVLQADAKTWENMDLITELKGELHKATGKWYEDRDTYREGAIACYNEHGNPDLKAGCPDFLDKSKLIGKAKYSVDERDIHIPKPFRQYLCYQCPYFQAYIIPDANVKKGLAK